MEYTENMHKVGDWVHTQNGVGIITNVFPVYQQYWDEEQELKERSNGLFKNDPEKEDKIFGKVPKSGKWIKDLITIKRLCNHDLEPLSRTMCFSSVAYANDKITQKAMREVNKLLKDPKIKKRFDKHECKYYEDSHAWKILIPPKKAVEIKKALDKLDNNANANLRITMKEIESYFKNDFDVDILSHSYYNNVAILTRSLLRNNPKFYNKDREKIFCQILIYKQERSTDEIHEFTNSKNIDESYYNQQAWVNYGWNGEDCGF